MKSIIKKMSQIKVLLAVFALMTVFSYSSSSYALTKPAADDGVYQAVQFLTTGGVAWVIGLGLLFLALLLAGRSMYLPAGVAALLLGIFVKAEPILISAGSILQ